MSALTLPTLTPSLLGTVLERGGIVSITLYGIVTMVTLPTLTPSLLGKVLERGGVVSITLYGIVTMITLPYTHIM